MSPDRHAQPGREATPADRAGEGDQPLTAERQLLTIVAESVLEHRLIDDVKRLGAKGYSITHVRGEGATGRVVLDFAGPSVRLESVVTNEVADRVFEVLRRDYFPHYAVVAWVTTVRVARPGHF